MSTILLWRRIRLSLLLRLKLTSVISSFHLLIRRTKRMSYWEVKKLMYWSFLSFKTMELIRYILNYLDYCHFGLLFRNRWNYLWGEASCCYWIWTKQWRSLSCQIRRAWRKSPILQESSQSTKIKMLLTMITPPLINQTSIITFYLNPIDVGKIGPDSRKSLTSTEATSIEKIRKAKQFWFIE